MNWKTKDGEIIKIKDMADSHLINSIKFIERNAERYVNGMKDFYLSCPPPNGEMANDCFETKFVEVMNLEPEDLCNENTKYRAMVKEAKSRKLVYGR